MFVRGVGSSTLKYGYQWDLAKSVKSSIVGNLYIIYDRLHCLRDFADFQFLALMTSVAPEPRLGSVWLGFGSSFWSKSSTRLGQIF